MENSSNYNLNNYVVIIAGGMGTRFWPASKTSCPKQFLDVLGVGKTLLQSTFERFEKFIPRENISVITLPEYGELVKKQLPNILPENIFIEPDRKNTAPCIVYSCYKIGMSNPNANIVIAPADHLILNETNFQNTLQRSLNFSASSTSLITIGIKPTKPSTGYGYIQYLIDERNQFKTVKTFTEKPNEELAKTFLESGDFLWNAGIFIWSFKTFLDKISRFMPEEFSLFEAIKNDIGSEKELKSISNIYSQLNNISIDYALLEKSDDVRVIPADFEWSDLGTWNSIYDQKEKDYLGNAVIGNLVRIYNSSNNFIYVPKGKLAIVQGVENCIIVDTGETLMILNKDQEQEVKTFTTDLKRDKLDQFL